MDYFLRLSPEYRATGWLVALLLLPVALWAQVLPRTFAGGHNHSLSIHADGTLWATGNNIGGQLGTGTTVSTSTWVQVGTATNWVQVVAGDYHSLGLRADGSLYAWGTNRYGELGNATNNSTDAANPIPTQVAGTYTQIAAGLFFSLGLRADGSLYAWGRNDFGQLGNGMISTGANPTPTREATIGTGWTTLGVGGSADFTLVRTASAQSFASTGPNGSGQLGDGTTTNASRFDHINLLIDQRLLPVFPAVASAGLSLYPNPAHGVATLTGAQPGTVVTVFDALGRSVLSAPATATGTAQLVLPQGLAAGVYVVRAGQQVLRLAVE